MFDFEGTEIPLESENFMEIGDDYQKCRSLVVTDGSDNEHVSLGTSFLQSAYVRLDFARN